MNPDEILDAVKEVLDGGTPLPLVQSLLDAVQGGTPKSDLDSTAAICFDSNVFLNLAKGRNAVNVIDYLDRKHTGPIILPSQVITEFWNNHLTSVEDYVGKLQRQFGELNDLIKKIEPQYSELREGAEKLTKDFQEEYGFVFNKSTRASLVALFDMLKNRATLSKLPRTDFAKIMEIRKQTKTPPGFEDHRDGDFYVWAEFLQGLLLAREEGKIFAEAIIVTDDVKKDWSTNGTAHPVLVAELFGLIGLPFRVLTFKELENVVQKALS